MLSKFNSLCCFSYNFGFLAGSIGASLSSFRQTSGISIIIIILSSSTVADIQEELQSGPLVVPLHRACYIWPDLCLPRFFATSVWQLNPPHLVRDKARAGSGSVYPNGAGHFAAVLRVRPLSTLHVNRRPAPRCNDLLRALAALILAADLYASDFARPPKRETCSANRTQARSK